MKKVYSIATLAFFAAAGLSAQNVNPAPKEASQAAHQVRTGQELISSIRQSFEKGGYDAFLANLQADYMQLVQSGKFTEFVKMRDVPPANEKLSQLAKHWEEVHQKLVRERNQQLLDACGKESDQLICQQIQSVAQETNDEQKEALQYLSSLRFKTPEAAQNGDERKLIDIDLSAEFKVVHLDIQFAEKPFQDRFEKHIAISMDMLKQMQEAGKTFQDASLKKKIDLAASAFDEWQARNYDLNQLNKISQKPSTDFEKKIASIINSYKAKKDDLYQKEFLAQLDEK